MKILKTIQFIVIFISTIKTMTQFVMNKEGGNLIFIIFIILLYLVSLYEIPIKTGMQENLTNRTIINEVLLVWILPVIVGCVLALIL